VRGDRLSAGPTLPPLYDRWVTALLGRAVEPEPLSTCASCAMCPGGGTKTRPASRIVLQPDLKCCTYTPTFPNYQVGAILVAEGPYADLARAQMRERLAGGREVTPMGVGVPAAQAGIDASLSNVTGLHEAQRCPHLVLTGEPGGTACAVWSNRDAVCATWWCRYERGASGLRAWWSLRFLFRGLEHALALWCCLEEGLDSDATYLLLGKQGVPRGATVGPEVERAHFWGALVGGEEAFYIRCHERVAALSWDDVLRVGGPDVVALARHVQTTWGRLDAPLPQRLTVGAHTVTGMAADGAAVETYSAYDPIALPTALLRVLHRFDGRPVSQVSAELAEVEGVAIDEGFLRALVDFGVLVPPA
jgi:hypothetical protein